MIYEVIENLTGLACSRDFLGFDIIMAVIPPFTRLLVSTSSCNLAILFSSNRILPCNASLIADKWLTLEGESLQQIWTCFDQLHHTFCQMLIDYLFPMENQTQNPTYPLIFSPLRKCKIFMLYLVMLHLPLKCQVAIFMPDRTNFDCEGIWIRNA